MPASGCRMPSLFADSRFDRYQEADVSTYGKPGTSQYDHLFADF